MEGIETIYRVRARNETMIYEFIGLPGEGKTHEMVSRAHDLQLQYPELKTYSNIHVAWPHIRLRSLEDLLQARNGIVILDESQRYFDAYDWQKLPQELRLKMQEHRHHGLEVFCTTQHPSFIAPSMRRIVHSWFSVRKLVGSRQGTEKPWGVILTREVEMYNATAELPDLIVKSFLPEVRLITKESVALYDSYGDIEEFEDDDVIEVVTRYKTCQECGAKRKVL